MSKLVFLSHSNVDDPEANRIADHLRQKGGLQMWLDHEEMDAGNEFRGEIHSALSACDSAIFLMTQDSIDSGECNAEWNQILQHHKPLYPLISSGISDLSNLNIPYRLTTFHVVDLRVGFTSGLNELHKTITRGSGLADYKKSKFLGSKQIVPLVQDLVSSPRFRFVRITFAVTFGVFVAIQAPWLAAIGAMLGLAASALSIRGLFPGSAIVYLRLPERGAELLVSIANQELDGMIVDNTALPLASIRMSSEEELRHAHAAFEEQQRGLAELSQPPRRSRRLLALDSEAGARAGKQHE